MILTHPEQEDCDTGIFRLMEGQCQEENDRSSELLGGCDRILKVSNSLLVTYTLMSSLFMAMFAMLASYVKL